MRIEKFQIKMLAVLVLFVGQCLCLQAGENIDEQSLSLKNLKVVDDKILSGGQPSLQDLKVLKTMGVTRIVNLRTTGEFDEFDEAAEVKKLGLEYHTIEVNGGDGVNLENASELDRLLASTQGRVLVHCGSGNRVGALFAVRAGAIQGKDVEQAIQLGKAAGLTRLEEKAKTVLKAQKAN